MEKSCEKCYWKESHYCKTCESFNEFEPSCNTCNADVAEFEFEGKTFCTDCMMKELGIEKREVTSHHYYMNGDYVGNDDEYMDSEIINIANNKARGI